MCTYNYGHDVYAHVAGTSGSLSGGISAGCLVPVCSTDSNRLRVRLAAAATAAAGEPVISNVWMPCGDTSVVVFLVLLMPAVKLLACVCHSAKLALLSTLL